MFVGGPGNKENTEGAFVWTAVSEYVLQAADRLAVLSHLLYPHRQRMVIKISPGTKQKGSFGATVIKPQEGKTAQVTPWEHSEGASATAFLQLFLRRTPHIIIFFLHSGSEDK